MLVLFAGCKALSPGADPVVVRAQQTAQATYAAVDAFLNFELANRDQLWKADPEIKHAADKLRATVPSALTALRTATKSYQVNKTPENSTALETSVNTVNSLIGEAQSGLNKAIAIKTP